MHLPKNKLFFQWDVQLKNKHLGALKKQSTLQVKNIFLKSTLQYDDDYFEDSIFTHAKPSLQLLRGKQSLCEKCIFVYQNARKVWGHVDNE